MKNIIIASFVALFVTSCATLFTQRKEADFDITLDVVHASKSHITVLPSNAIVNMVEFSGTKKRQDNYEYFVEDLINRFAPEALNKIGLSASFLSKGDIHNLKVSRDYSIVIDEFKEMKSKMYGSALAIDDKIAHRWKHSNIQHLSKLYQAKQSDLYAIFEYEGMVKTTGSIITKAAISAIAGVGSTEPDVTYVMFVCLADAQNSTVLWCNAALTNKDVGSGMFGIFKSKQKAEEEHIQMLLDAVLLPLKKVKG